MMKECSICGKVKSYFQFHTHRASKCGLRLSCKKCENKKERERRKNVNYKVTVTDKKCSICKKTKPHYLFGPDRRNSSGLRCECRECDNAASVKRQKGSDYKVTITHKRCSQCGEIKSVDFYNLNKRKKTGINCTCKQCIKVNSKKLNVRLGSYANKIKKAYGITLDDIQAMTDNQKGVCKCCGVSLVDKYSKKQFSVDHDHTTGKVRGLLCNSCNTGIGLLGDNLAGVLKAVEYLRNV